MNTPLAIKAYQNGTLTKRKNEALAMLESCVLCPRKCGVNRIKNQVGICKTGRLSKIASYGAHFGEEAPLINILGSGTIFFSNCNLNCMFCQNFDISQEGAGREVNAAQLAKIMLYLQKQGCHNINFVTPSHVIPQILEAVEIAMSQGFETPLVYNTSSYDNIDSLKLLDGIIDIYLADFKFWDAEVSSQTCKADDFPEIAREALMEMHRQVGDLIIENGNAIRGLVVRHLVFPENKAGTKEIMQFISTSISKNTYVNIMDQYRPCSRAEEIDWLNKEVTFTEFLSAKQVAAEFGLSRGF